MLNGEDIYIYRNKYDVFFGKYLEFVGISER